MGYRGKVIEQERARELRAEGLTLQDIADELQVAKSSVSLWVTDVPFTPSPRRRGPKYGPNKLQLRKLAEIERLDSEGIARIGLPSSQAFLAAGAALYAGEGSKGDGRIVFANSDAAMMRFFAQWLRRFFDIDESKFRVRVYLHQGLDLDAAQSFWSQVTGVPLEQFRTAYRAVPDPSIRHNKHQYGCAYLIYNCTRTHRAVMGLVRALLNSNPQSGVAQLVVAPDC